MVCLLDIQSKRVKTQALNIALLVLPPKTHTQQCPTQHSHPCMAVAFERRSSFKGRKWDSVHKQVRICILHNTLILNIFFKTGCMQICKKYTHICVAFAICKKYNKLSLNYIHKQQISKQLGKKNYEHIQLILKIKTTLLYIHQSKSIFCMS